VLPGAADSARTAKGVETGVIALEGDEAGPVPAELIAATVTVYSAPLTNPLIVQGEDEQALVDTTVPVPVGVAINSYAVIAAPPVNPGAVNPTVIACDEADAEVNVGEVGTVAMT